MKGHPVILSNELEHVTHTPTKFANFWLFMFNFRRKTCVPNFTLNRCSTFLISHDLKKYKNELSSNFSLLLKKSKKLEKKIKPSLSLLPVFCLYNLSMTFSEI